MDKPTPTPPGPARKSERFRRDTEATEDTEPLLTPLFTVERREVIGTVFEDPGSNRHPVMVGFEMIAATLAQATNPTRVQFTYDGMTFAATAAPEATDGEQRSSWGERTN